MNGYRIYFADDSILENYAPTGLTREVFGYAVYDIMEALAHDDKNNFAMKRVPIKYFTDLSDPTTGQLVCVLHGIKRNGAVSITLSDRNGRYLDKPLRMFTVASYNKGYQKH